MPVELKSQIDMTPACKKKSICDWNMLMNFNQFRFVAGVDMDDTDAARQGIRASARCAAVCRGVKCRTKTVGKDIVVQFYDA